MEISRIKSLFRKGTEKKSAGTRPGTLVHIGERKMDETTIELIEYSPTELNEKKITDIKEVFPSRDNEYISWININGLHKIDIIEALGDHFGIHALLLEDVLNTNQRPKLEEYEDFAFVVLKMLYFEKGNEEVTSEQISIFLSDKYVITLQEQEGDVFNPIRERLQNEKGNLRKMGTGYLTYALMDAVVDNYFVVMEKIGDQVETLELQMTKDLSNEMVRDIHALKREIIFLRKSIWPLREVVNSFIRGDIKFMNKKVENYLRDLYDHTVQVIDNVESLRDVISGVLDLYLSMVGNKTNEVMRVLTIIGTIFIPLTFIVGVYGMNFKYMPELDVKSGYFIVWGIMILITVGLVIYFKRKNWL